MSRLLGYDLSSDGHHPLYNVSVMRSLQREDRYDRIGYYTQNAGKEWVAELANFKRDAAGRHDGQLAPGEPVRPLHPRREAVRR